MHRTLVEGPLAPLASCIVSWRLLHVASHAVGHWQRSPSLLPAARFWSWLGRDLNALNEALNGARLCGELLPMCLQRTGEPCSAIILFIGMPIRTGSTCSTHLSID